MGAEKPRCPHAHAGSGRRRCKNRGFRGRAPERKNSHRFRCCRLLCALSQALHGRLGTPVNADRSRGQGAPLSRSRCDSELTFDNVREHSLEWIWQESCAFQKFRGESWMPEPCRSCDRRAEDFGGCRCQALLLTGDASATDPACSLAPSHLVIDLALLEVPIETSPPQGELIYRANPK